MKIIIWSPGFDLASGGAIVLHKSCKLLRAAGADAAMWTADGSSADYYGNPHVREWEDAGVVYPETVNANPLGGYPVVRLLLNTPGRMLGPDGIAGDGVYDPDDIVLNGFLAGQETDRLDVFERFPQWIHQRDAEPWLETCFAVRKGAAKPRDKRLDAQSWELPAVCRPEDVGPIFRRHTRFYSYDSSTWLSLQAVLCGCRSYVIPDEGVSAGAWRAGHVSMKYGVNYGLDDSYGDKTRHLVEPWLAECQRQTARQIDRLLERIRRKYSSRSA